MWTFRILTAVLLSLAICACQKKDHFSGTGTLGGRLAYVPHNDGTQTAVALAKCRVYLAEPGSDRLNYLYSKLTDEDGYFSFEQLKDGHAYDLFFRDTINGLPYLAFLTKTTNDDKIQLIARLDELQTNGVSITTRSVPGDILPRADLCIFNNRIAAMTGTCEGRVLNRATDSLGKAVIYGLSPGWYFVRASWVSGATAYRTLDSFQIMATGITTSELRLSASSMTGFQLRTISASGSVFPNASVCIFNTAVLAATDSCSASVIQTSTDQNGQLVSTGLMPGRYYLRGSYRIGQRLFKAYDSVDVLNGALANAVLRMEEVIPATTGFELLLIDASGSPLNGATVCVFVNRSFFNADTCAGNIFTRTSGNSGKVQELQLVPGRYFIRAEVAIGGTSLIGRDSLDVVQNLVTPKTIILR